MDALIVYWLLIATMKYAAGEKNCISLSEPRTLRTYYGWPVSFECSEIASDCEIDAGNYECNVTRKDTNETVFTGDFDYSDYYAPFLSYTIGNVTSETPSEFVVKTSSSDTCCSQKFRLRRFTLPNITCAEFHESSDSLENEVEPTNSRSITCVVPDSSNEPRLSASDYPIQWYHNCNSTLPDDVEKLSTDKIRISSFDPFKHTGHYSCSIVHNGETRFISERRLCVKPRRPITEISARCYTEKIRYKVGDTATIICDINVGSSYTDPNEFNMNFYPLFENRTRNPARDNVSCTSKLEVDRSAQTTQRTSLDNRVSCSFIRIRDAQEPNCLSHIPTQEEWQREENKTSQLMQMTYSIKNLQSEDFGWYQAYVSYKSQSNSAIQNVTIVMDMGEQEKAGLIGGVLVGTVVALLIIAALIYYYRLNLRLLWRRSSCVPHDKDTMTYGAYFTYSWSNDSGEAMANKTYGDLISGMRNFVQELGFKIYDPAVEPAQCQWTILNTKEVQQNCDRVIVILTEKFLEQPTAEQDLYESFLDKTFILIKTPEFDDAFKSLDQDRKNGLKAHFQRNFTINWSGKGGALSNKFQIELELAMPKKRKSHSDDVSFSMLQNSV